MQLKELGVITPTEPHNNIAAAINAAQQAPGGAVWIPAWYTGTDSVPTTPGVPVIDMRGTSGSFSGSSNSNLTQITQSGLMAEYRILPTETVTSLIDYSGNGNTATGTTGTAPTIIANTGGINCGGAGAVTLPSALNSALTVMVYMLEALA